MTSLTTAVHGTIAFDGADYAVKIVDKSLFVTKPDGRVYLTQAFGNIACNILRSTLRGEGNAIMEITTDHDKYVVIAVTNKGVTGYYLLNPIRDSEKILMESPAETKTVEKAAKSKNHTCAHNIKSYTYVTKDMLGPNVKVFEKVETDIKSVKTEIDAHLDILINPENPDYKKDQHYIRRYARSTAVRGGFYTAKTVYSAFGITSTDDILVYPYNIRLQTPGSICVDTSCENVYTIIARKPRATADAIGMIHVHHNIIMGILPVTAQKGRPESPDSWVCKIDAPDGLYVNCWTDTGSNFTILIEDSKLYIVGGVFLENQPIQFRVVKH